MLTALYVDAATLCCNSAAQSCFVGSTAGGLPNRHRSISATAVLPSVFRGNADIRRSSSQLSSLLGLHELGLREGREGEPGTHTTATTATSLQQQHPISRRKRRRSRIENLATCASSQSERVPSFQPARWGLPPHISASFANSFACSDVRHQNRRYRSHIALLASKRGGDATGEEEPVKPAESHSKAAGLPPTGARTRKTLIHPQKNLDDIRENSHGDYGEGQTPADVVGENNDEISSPTGQTRGISTSAISEPIFGGFNPSAELRVRQAKESMKAKSNTKIASSKPSRRKPAATQDLQGPPMPQAKQLATSASSTQSSKHLIAESPAMNPFPFDSKNSSGQLKDIVTSSLKRGRRRGASTKQSVHGTMVEVGHTGEGRGGRRVTGDANLRVDSVGIRDGKAVANRVMPTQRAFDKRKGVSRDQNELLESGEQARKDRQQQQQQRTAEILANSVMPTQRAFDKSSKQDGVSSITSDPGADGSRHSRQLQHEDYPRSFREGDGFVVHENADVDQAKGGERDEDLDLLGPMEVAAILAARQNDLSSARGVDQTTRSWDDDASDVDSKDVPETSRPVVTDQIAIGLRNTQESPTHSDHTDYDGRVSSDKSIVVAPVSLCEGDGEEEVSNNIMLADIPTSDDSPPTSISHIDEGDSEGPSHMSLSLKERLGLTDEELQALVRSHRAGLANDQSVERKLTGPASGGAKTAVGYLLGELRMKPGEVKEAVLRCPQLLKLTRRGPHGVASWLQGGLGLSADDVAKMVRRHPSTLTYSIIHNLRPKFRWLQEELGLTRARSIRLVLRCPAVFGLSIDENMFPKVEWLTTELRMTKKEAASVIFGNPGVLLSSVERSLEPKITWMVQHLYLERDMVIDMIRRYPMFFSLSSDGNLGPKIKWLAAQASNDIVRRVIFRQPSLLGHNAQGNLAPKVQWLQDRLGMTEEAAWNLIGKSPGFLTLSVADTLEPKLWWLRDKLDMTLQGAAKLVAIYPTLFDLSIEDSLEPKLWWVRDALGLDRPDAAAVLRRCPQIFGSSLKETLEPKISWLTRRLKTTRERVAGMVVRYPQLLTYSIDSNLAPTIDFFEFDMGEVKPEELVDGLEARPSALSASLDRRLTVRVAKMRSAGVEPNFKAHFQTVTRLTDPQFKAWLSKARAELKLQRQSNGEGDEVSRGKRPRSTVKAPRKATGYPGIDGRTTIVSGKKKKMPTVATKNIAAENI